MESFINRFGQFHPHYGTMLVLTIPCYFLGLIGMIIVLLFYELGKIGIPKYNTFLINR